MDRPQCRTGRIRQARYCESVAWVATTFGGGSSMSLSDPRLAVVYDIDNPDGPDHDYFRRLADEVGAREIVDLGCGTGLLTVTLTGPRRTVTGIDPDPSMLARAVSRPGGQAVTWRLGTADQLPGCADLVIMSGNVAMHIIGDDWHSTLSAIAASLVPGGTLVFESRNPQARAWATWNEPLSERQTPAGLLRESLTTEPPGPDGVVLMHCYNEFPETGDIVAGEQLLQFRSHEQIEADLGRAGLRLQAICRNWQGDIFTGGSEQPLMVIRASPVDA